MFCQLFFLSFNTSPHLLQWLRRMLHQGLTVKLQICFLQYKTRVSGWCLNFNFEWAYPLKCWCMFRVDIQKKSSSQSNWATTTCCKFSHEILWPAVLLLVFQLKPKSDTPKDRVIRRKMAIGSSSDVCCFAQYHAIRWRARPIFGSLICSSHSLHR